MKARRTGTLHAPSGSPAAFAVRESYAAMASSQAVGLALSLATSAHTTRSGAKVVPREVMSSSSKPESVGIPLCSSRVLVDQDADQLEAHLESKNAARQAPGPVASNLPSTDFSLSSAPVPALVEQDVTAAFPSATGTTGSASMVSNIGLVRSDTTSASNRQFSWEMMSLGLEEALPSPEVIDDL